MKGWRLTQGKIAKKDVTDKEILQCFNFIFSSKSRNKTSYKFGLIRALLENLYNVDSDLRLSYDKLYYTFAKIYWNLVIKRSLRQTDKSHVQSSIEKILYKCQKEFGIPLDVIFDRIPVKAQLEIVKRVKIQGKRYVIGALYGDSNGIFYEFSNRDEYLLFNRSFYQFAQRFHQMLNEKWGRFRFCKGETNVSPFIIYLP